MLVYCRQPFGVATIVSVIISFLLMGESLNIPTEAPTISPAPSLLPTPVSLSSIEYSALEDVYFSLGGPNWIYKFTNGIPWNFQNNRLDNPCADNWAGVSCNCVDIGNPVVQSGFCFVESLNLTTQNLSGTLPDSVGSLSYLVNLEIAGLRVEGTLPVGLSNLTSLRYLSIHNTVIHGRLSPVILKGWESLEVLNLYQNRLTGHLPLQLYSLTTLNYLNLGSNNFTGVISLKVTNLRRLTVLNLRTNEFHGTILSFLANMTSLERIDLGLNQFSSTLPPNLNNLTNLEIFDISFNRFSGTLPENIGLSWLWLRIFDVTANQLGGTLPANFGINMFNLQRLYLTRNQFSGTLPQTILQTHFQELRAFYIETNRFSGSFGNNSFSQMTYLAEVGFENNLFDGTIEYMFVKENGDYRPLRFLSFGSNLFYGKMPLISTDFLQLYSGEHNEFTGTIPNYFSNAALLIGFAVSYNQLTGRIPDWQGELPVLIFNVVAHNYLTSTIPNTFLNTTKIKDIIYNDNFLTQSIPKSASDIKDLIELYLQNNMLTGVIPKNIFAILRLEITYVQNNFITGPLLPQYNIDNIDNILNNLNQDMIDQIKQNYSYNGLITSSLINVDVSNNRITGTVPPLFFVFAPRLRAYVLSSNCFVGAIPKTICESKSLTSLGLDGLGSAKSCQKPLFPDIPYFTSFRSSNPVNGGVPACLFQMPDLEILRLSGNGLTGTLPEDLNDINNISKTLTQLSVANNDLSGTIPKGIQEKSWLDLDLSFNRIGGTLLPTFAPININSTVTLQLNRLSGSIPNAFLVDDDPTVGEINILDGNIFSCQDLFGTRGKKLPPNDPNRHIYSCGSDIINRALLLWVFFVLGMTAVTGIGLSMIYTPTGRNLYEKMTSRRNSTKTLTKDSAVGESEHHSAEKDRGSSVMNNEYKDGASRPSQIRASEREPSFFSRLSSFLPGGYLDSDLDGASDAGDEVATNVTKPWYWKPWMDDVYDWISILSTEEQQSQPTGKGLVPVDLHRQESTTSSKNIPLPQREPLYQLVEFMKSIRFIFFAITVFLLCFMMPWCEMLTTHLGGGTYTYEYAWSTSAILQSGYFSGISLFIMFALVVTLVITLFEYCFHEFWEDEEKRDKMKQQKLLDRKRRQAAVAEGSSSVDSKDNQSNKKSVWTTCLTNCLPSWCQEFCGFSSNSLSNLWTKDEQAIIARKRFENRTIFKIVGFINLVLMILIDILYVVIILRSNVVVVFFTQVGLGIFKLLWNEMFLWKVIPYLKYFLFRQFDHNKTNTSTSSQSAGAGAWDINQYKFSKPEVSFIILTVLLNNIIIPSFSIAVVSSDCYYNAFFAEPPETTTTLYECEYALSLGLVERCIGETAYTEDITYYPPFSYRYQCSAAFITNYAAVYVYMFILVGLVIPSGKIMLKLLYDQLIIDDSSSSSSHQQQGNDNPNRSSARISARLTAASAGEGTYSTVKIGVVADDPSVMNPVHSSMSGTSRGTMSTALNERVSRTSSFFKRNSRSIHGSSVSDLHEHGGVEMKISGLTEADKQKFDDNGSEKEDETTPQQSAVNMTSTTPTPAAGPFYRLKIRLLRFIESILPENLRDIQFANDIEEIDIRVGSDATSLNQTISTEDSEDAQRRSRSTSISIFLQDRMTSIGQRMASIVRDATNTTSNTLLFLPTTTTMMNFDQLAKENGIKGGMNSETDGDEDKNALNNVDGILQTGVGALDEREEKALFFYRNKFVVKMNAYFGILLTFGTIFPPLSLLICVAAFTSTWYEHLVLGRVLVLAQRHRRKVLKQLEQDAYRLKLQWIQQQQQQQLQDQQRQPQVTSPHNESTSSSPSSTSGTASVSSVSMSMSTSTAVTAQQQHQKLQKRLALVKDYYRLLRQKLNKEVSGISLYFSTSMWIVLVFGCLSYAFVLFDTFGDVGGWQGAVIPTSLMVVWPAICYVMRWFITQVKSWRQQKKGDDLGLSGSPMNHNRDLARIDLSKVDEYENDVFDPEYNTKSDVEAPQELSNSDQESVHSMNSIHSQNNRSDRTISTGTYGEVPSTKSEEGRSAVALSLMNSSRSLSMVSTAHAGGSIRHPITSTRQRNQSQSYDTVGVATSPS